MKKSRNQEVAGFTKMSKGDLLYSRNDIIISFADYNNIYLGKRMFGPARKQKFVRTILGGIERRYG